MKFLKKIETRNATASDIPFLLALRQETMEPHLVASGAGMSAVSHEARVMHLFEYAEILMLHGKPVGLVKLRKSPTEWEIVQFQLSPALHGKGVGRFILSGIISKAEAAGVLLKLSVLRSNPAIRLYKRLGFSVVGEDALEFYMQRASAQETPFR